MSLEQVIAELTEKLDRRFYGKYRGFVVDNADPQHLGRLKVKVPSLLGPDVVTGWALPCVPYGGMDNQGFLFIPDVGAGVWVEFEEGDLEFPIWTGTFWSKPGGASELPKPNDEDGKQANAEQNLPTRKIIKTKKGHTIQLEDGDGEERIIIVDGQSENRIVFTKGNIIVNGEQRVCLDGLIDWLLNHTHLGNMGGPCSLNPPDTMKLTSVQQQPDGQILSKKTKMG
jgi:hypothetical protein